MGGVTLQVELVHVGLGFGSLMLVLIAQTVVIGVWAGRVTQTLRHFDERWNEEIPQLRSAKHEHANWLTSHDGRFQQMQDRMDQLLEMRGEFKSVWSRIEKDEDARRLVHERLGALEHAVGVRGREREDDR